MTGKMTKDEWKELVKGLLLIMTLIGTGLGFGYWYRGQEVEQAHQKEIERIQRNHEVALEYLNGKVSRTADKVEDAANAAAEAANKVANNAKRGPQQVQPTKAENNAVNLAIEKANNAIKD